MNMGFSKLLLYSPDGGKHNDLGLKDEHHTL